MIQKDEMGNDSNDQIILVRLYTVWFLGRRKYLVGELILIAIFKSRNYSIHAIVSSLVK